MLPRPMTNLFDVHEKITRILHTHVYIILFEHHTYGAMDVIVPVSQHLENHEKVLESVHLQIQRGSKNDSIKAPNSLPHQEDVTNHVH